jgi:uncharacterized membrane protein YczE
VLAAGWALGGSVGIATVVFATSIGPLVKHALERLSLDRRYGDPHPRTPSEYAA